MTTTFSVKTPMARKEHRCVWCGEPIPTGERYVRHRLIFDGMFQSNAFHRECDEAAARDPDVVSYGFETHEQPRGQTQTEHES